MKPALGRVELAASFAVAGSFLAGPLRLLSGFSARPFIIYGLVAPIVGLLLVLRHPRARFAAYIFLSLDLIRTAVHGSWPYFAADLAVLLFLQMPLMRRVYPPIDPARIAARWRRSGRP